MNPGERLRATYEFRPVDHLVRTEFYIWEEAIEKWKMQGLPADYDYDKTFLFEPSGLTWVDHNLGWCEAPFIPGYESKIIRVEGDIEIYQDWAGRWLKGFKGRRHGFMPEYIKHPVTCMKDWEEDVRPRLNPVDPLRFEKLDERCKKASDQQASGLLVRQGLIGGYMYLRSLVGPVELLYMVHDQPELVHAMMRQWADVMNASIERIQAHIEFDELAIAEDICFNHGMLISPDMWREFLFPYYQDVVQKARSRQRRKLYFFVDTDGLCMPAIPLYLELGMDVMSPFEVASGCDVVEAAKQYPNLIMWGGIDKRVMAAGKDAIDAHLKHIMPFMLKRGGYIPTCDHGVPDDVSLENYLYYRKRICELDH